VTHEQGRLEKFFQGFDVRADRCRRDIECLSRSGKTQVRRHGFEGSQRI
jgi:hypothetical protein